MGAASAILGDMSSDVAAFLRQRTTEDVLALTPRERLDLALRLGDEDLARYMAATGCDRAAALRDLRRARAVGRRPSVANEY